MEKDPSPNCLKAVMKIGILLIFVLVLICTQIIAKEINPDDVFISPDGRFTVRFTDEVMNLKIKDNQTGKITTSGVLTPCYSLKWTGDSKTIVAIYHLAGGSDADIFHFSKNKWNRCKMGAPDQDFNFIDVTSEKIGTKKIELTYRAGVRDPRHDTFFTYSLSFNPETGATTLIGKHEIDEETYEKLHSYSGAGYF